jgi:hypothetical protein
LRGAHRVPFLGRDNGEQVLDPDDLHAGISATDFSSTETGTAPATIGLIIRACSMPGSRTSATMSSCAKTFWANPCGGKTARSP